MLNISHDRISGPELDRLAQDAIRAILATIPGTRVARTRQASRPGAFEVHLTNACGRQVLLCETRSRAWPNEIYAIAYRLNEGAKNCSVRSCVPVLIAPYVSQQAADTCARLGISWIDLAGNCELNIDGAFVKVRGSQNPYKQGRGTASLYSPKSANVIHALLLEPRRKWTTLELSIASEVSPGQVSNVRKLLGRNNWVTANYGSTFLTAPQALLEDWAHHYQPKRRTIHLFSLDSPHVLERRIAANFPGYAFTEFSAAESYAPYARHQKVSCYVPHWDDRLARILDLKAGDGAANVTIYESSSTHLFVEEVNHLRCVSPILTYLDLQLLPGRAHDAAEHLLEKVIQPRWA